MKKDRFQVKGGTLEDFKTYLLERENAASTVEKYLRDVRTFFQYLGQKRQLSKEGLLGYKQWLQENYAVNSVNSMLAALNQFLIFSGLERMRLKSVKVQRQDFQNLGKELGKEEFHLLIKTARNQGEEQLAMLMETMCSTGIRVSELKYFSVENVRTGLIKVWNKGKHRLVILPKALQKRLLLFIKKEKIRSGPVFRTRSGMSKNRSNIWREMKRLAEKAGVPAEKVFPHNLRHLFARVFYRQTKNLLNLADILGHSSLEVTRIYASQGYTEWKRNIEKLKILETT